MIRKEQIKINFDLKRKNFIFSIPIFQESTEGFSEVKKYIEARKNCSFKPHATSFRVAENGAILLIQELPFNWGFQPGFREKIGGFWQLAKHCRRILVEISLEEKHKTAIQIIFSTEQQILD